ncbi:MAG: ABC transporter permease [Oscillospiraceae bacterium]|jgi:ribose/xylose/arabinose/galactoside ABC-type transport system permease subunit|nr:ABC transporter permease [Oscillospiraceae bacterium]
MEKKSFLKRLTQSKMFVLLLLYIAVAAFYTIISKGQYLYWVNIRNILSSMVITAYLTCGAVFLMISGNIDLSTAQVSTISGILMAQFLMKGFPWPLAILAVLAGAALVGFINAVLINEVKFQPFVATMAVSYMVQGGMLLLSHGAAVEVSNKYIVWLGTYRIAGQFPVNILFTFAIFTIYGVVLAKTKFGKKIYMVGGNPVAAKLSGINPKKVWYILFINNAVLGSVAGMLQAARLRSGSATGIAGGAFAGMTGAILGGVSFGGGSGGMGGAFVGLVLLNGFNSGLTLIGINPYWQTMASGALLLIALTFDYFNTKRLMRR